MEVSACPGNDRRFHPRRRLLRLLTAVQNDHESTIPLDLSHVHADTASRRPRKRKTDRRTRGRGATDPKSPLCLRARRLWPRPRRRPPGRRVTGSAWGKLFRTLARPPTRLPRAFACPRGPPVASERFWGPPPALKDIQFGF